MIEVVTVADFRSALGQAEFPEAEDLLFEALHELRRRLDALPKPTLPGAFVDELNRMCEGRPTSLDVAACMLSSAENGLAQLRGQGVPEWRFAVQRDLPLVEALPENRAKNSALLYLLSLQTLVNEVPPWLDFMDGVVVTIRKTLFPAYDAFRKTLTTDELRALNADIEKLVIGHVVMPLIRDVAAVRAAQLSLRELIDDKAPYLIQEGRVLSALEGEELSIPAEQLVAKVQGVLDRAAQIEDIEDFVTGLPGDLSALSGEREPEGEKPPPPPAEGTPALVPKAAAAPVSGVNIVGAVITGVTTVIIINALTRRRREQSVSGLGLPPDEHKAIARTDLKSARVILRAGYLTERCDRQLDSLVSAKAWAQSAKAHAVSAHDEWLTQDIEKFMRKVESNIDDFEKKCVR